MPEGKATDAKKVPPGLKSKMGGMMKLEQAGVSLKILQTVTKEVLQPLHTCNAAKRHWAQEPNCLGNSDDCFRLLLPSTSSLLRARTRLCGKQLSSTKM